MHLFVNTKKPLCIQTIIQLLQTQFNEKSSTDKLANYVIDLFVNYRK